jgi:hypothetical protein
MLLTFLCFQIQLSLTGDIGKREMLEAAESDWITDRQTYGELEKVPFFDMLHELVGKIPTWPLSFVISFGLPTPFGI